MTSAAKMRIPKPQSTNRRPNIPRIPFKERPASFSMTLPETARANTRLSLLALIYPSFFIISTDQACRIRIRVTGLQTPALAMGVPDCAVECTYSTASMVLTVLEAGAECEPARDEAEILRNVCR